MSESRYPDEEAGEIPMAYVVRKPGTAISATQIMEFIAKQASQLTSMRRDCLYSSTCFEVLNFLFNNCGNCK